MRNLQEKKFVANLSKRKIPDFLIKLSSFHSWENIFFPIKARLFLTVRPTPQTHDQALGHPIIRPNFEYFKRGSKTQHTTR